MPEDLWRVPSIITGQILSGNAADSNESKISGHFRNVGPPGLCPIPGKCLTLYLLILWHGIALVIIYTLPVLLVLY